MQHSTYGSVRLVLAGCAALQLACGSNSPAGPSSAPDAGFLRGTGAGTAVAQNLPPNLNLKTRPAMSGNTVSGEAPFTVEFNLCNSDDPDAGDSLNQQFHFGDSGKPAFNPNGTFNPDFEHFCRVEHTYQRPGTYTATVSLTDKHLEDQSRNVSSAARKTQTVTVQAFGREGPGCAALGVNVNFDGFAAGTPGAALGIPGVTFAGGQIFSGFTFTTISGNQLISSGTITATFASDQSAGTFRFATNPGVTLTVQGFSGTGAPVFTAGYVGVVQPTGLPEGAGGGNAVFRSLEFSATGTYVIDNLSTTPLCQ